jgi:putative SOS response-associated peptidase YedK
MRLGLVPYWSKTPAPNSDTVNAKAETILQKHSYREPIRKRRCIVPINNYFEWQKIDPNDRKKKVAWAIGLENGKPFGLAAIRDRWEAKDSDLFLEIFSIITCVPNDKLKPFYERMPVILRPEDYDRWLEPGDPQNPPLDLLVPFPSELTKAWRIKRDVGNADVNRPDLVDPNDPTSEPPDPLKTPRKSRAKTKPKPEEPPMLF